MESCTDAGAGGASKRPVSVVGAGWQQGTLAVRRTPRARDRNVGRNATTPDAGVAWFETLTSDGDCGTAPLLRRRFGRSPLRRLIEPPHIFKLKAQAHNKFKYNKGTRANRSDWLRNSLGIKKEVPIKNCLKVKCAVVFF